MGSGRTVNLPSSPIALLSAQTVDRPVVVYANGGVAVGGDNPQVTKRSKKVKK